MSREAALILRKSDVQPFFASLAQEMRIIAPRRYFGGDVMFGEVQSPKEIAWYYGHDLYPPKRFLLPHYEDMFRYESNGGKVKIENAAEAPKQAIVGIRSCDVKAIRFQEKFYGQPIMDDYYMSRLENTILDSENPHKLRISLMGGPVFGPKDRKFVQNDEETMLPDEYWKVIAFRDDTDNQEKVFAFLLTQKHLVEALAAAEGLDLEPWLWARITLQDLQAKTGIRFDAALRQREVPFVAPQVAGDGPSLKIVTRPDEYFASR